MPKKKDMVSNTEDNFTTVDFVMPNKYQTSIYLMIGLSNGIIWVFDSRVN